MLPQSPWLWMPAVPPGRLVRNSATKTRTAEAVVGKSGRGAKVRSGMGKPQFDMFDDKIDIIKVMHYPLSNLDADPSARTILMIDIL